MEYFLYAFTDAHRIVENIRKLNVVAQNFTVEISEIHTIEKAIKAKIFNARQHQSSKMVSGMSMREVLETLTLEEEATQN